MKKVIYILMVAVVMSSCHWMHEKHRDGVAVELSGKTLTYAQLDEITRAASTAEDSAMLAEAYIRQWATDILEYQEARDRANNELEALVEDYRRSLYVHEYEQNIVARHQPKEWPDSVVEQLYMNYQDRLRLKEGIMKGVLLIVPQNTPQLPQVKTWLSNLNDDNIEKIEKYAYNYATGYEYFPHEWHTVNQILLRLPLETDILTDKMNHHSQIVVEDSTSVYLLQVTDKHMRGDIMPMDYARESIHQILLNQWQIEYLQQERQQLFEAAERYNQLKRYEK